MADTLWTRSQKQAWAYVESAINKDMEEVEALQQYRAGGGRIRTSSWVELWHRAEESTARWNDIYQLKGTDYIPESMYGQVDIAYKEKYIMTFTTDIRDALGGIVHNVHRQVESAERLTLNQWVNAANESLQEDMSIDVSAVWDIRDIEFFTH